MKFGARILLLLAATLVGLRAALACCCLAELSPQEEPAVAELPACHGAGGAPPADIPRVDSQACADCADCADLEPAPATGESRAVQKKDRSFEVSSVRNDCSPAAVVPRCVRIVEPPPLLAQPAKTPVYLKQRLLI